MGAESVSWYEPEPRLSTALLHLAGVGADASVVDVGGGASPLARTLVEAGHRDVTVVDISSDALEVNRSTVDPDRITWVKTDVLEWEPGRQWDVWHDRAVFHFLTDPEQRIVYLDLLGRSVSPGGVAVLVTFAEDGPTSCSGLPVHRHSPDELLLEMGPRFSEITSGHADHRTPAGGAQHLSFVVARADGGA